MTCPTLVIDDVIVPTQSLVNFDQTYAERRGEVFQRTADGSGVLRSTWAGKLGTVISGDGWAPSAFDNLAAGTTFLLKCAMPRAVSDSTNTITIPANRRSDAGHEPYGYALVDGLLVETPVSGTVGNDVTLTPVAGAVGYRVNYYPEITVAITGNDTNTRNDGGYRWSVEAEEI